MAAPKKRPRIKVKSSNSPIVRYSDADFNGHAPIVVEDGGRTLSLVNAASFKPKAVKWFWQDRIPLRAITMLAGPGGEGKSTVAAKIASKATHGRLDGAFRGEPVDVVIASTEDTAAEVLVPRLIAVEADRTRVHFPKLNENGQPATITIEHDLTLLESALQKSKAKLLILDPLISYLDEATDTDRDHKLRRSLDPLKDMAEDLTISVVAIIHVNKSETKRLIDRIMGSAGFVNAPRSVLVVAAHPEAEDEADRRRILGHPKSNWGVRQPALHFDNEPVYIQGNDVELIPTNRATFTHESSLDIEQLLKGQQSAAGSTAIGAAKEFLKDALKDGVRSVADLQKAATSEGHHWRNVQTAKVQLKILHHRPGYGANMIWALTKEDLERWKATDDT